MRPAATVAPKPIEIRFLPTMMQAVFEKHEDTTTYSYRGGLLG